MFGSWLSVRLRSCFRASNVRRPATRRRLQIESLEDRLTPALSITPAGLNPGDQFAVVFVTSTSRDGTSPNIADYDAVVAAAASAAGIDTYGGTAVTWRALASTPSVSAKGRFNPTVPIFRMDGTRIASNGADLWDGLLQNPIDRNENGAQVGGGLLIWTGSLLTGDGNQTLGAGFPFANAGTPSISSSWMSNGSKFNTEQHAFYGFSSILTAQVLPEVTVAVSPASVTEDSSSSLTYTFTRTGSTAAALTVNLSNLGTAQIGTDFTVSGATLDAKRGTLTFGAGSATATVTVTPTTDSLVEPDETAVLSIISGTGYTVGTTSSASGTITDDDTATVSISGAPVVQEGNSLNFTVSLSQVSSTDTRVVLTVGGSASGGSDFKKPDSQIVLIKAGDKNATFSLTTLDDGLTEGDETVVVTINSISSGDPQISIDSSASAATGTIQDGNQAPSFDAFLVEAAENAVGPIAIPVVDPDNGPQPLSFQFAGGADDNRFKLNSDGTLTFLSVPNYEQPDDADGDGLYEVRLTASDGIATTTETLQILLNDVNEAPTILSPTAANPVTVIEGTVLATTASAQDPDSGTTLKWQLAGGADAALFTIDSISGKLSFRTAPSFATPGDSNKDNIYLVNILVTDGELAATESLQVRVLAGPSLSGAASTVEGATYSLQLLVASPELYATPITCWVIKWGDGSTSNFSGVSGTVNHVYADGPASYSITATAYSSAGSWVARNPIAVAVTNLKPVVDFKGPATATRNQAMAFSATLSDVPADTLQVTVNWGDGSPVKTLDVGNASSWSDTHTWTSLGTRTITFTVTDDDGGVTTTVQQITIRATELQADPLEPTKNSLVIQGDSTVDKVVLNKAGGLVTVSLNGTDQGSYAVTGRVIIYGGAGNDSLQSPITLDVPVYFDGGSGNDTLTGGAAADVLIGGPGDDLIQGNGGRDLVIGGTGADRLLGGADEDLLIGGWTTYDADQAALTLILQEWRRTDVSASLRRDHLRSGADTALNGATCLLSEGTDATVFDDKVQDQLTGGTDTLDWLFLNSDGDGGIFDRALDAATVDFLEDLDWRA